jgi:hypothetical protein
MLIYVNHLELLSVTHVALIEPPLTLERKLDLGRLAARTQCRAGKRQRR